MEEKIVQIKYDGDIIIHTNEMMKDWSVLFDKGFWEYIEIHYDEICNYIEKKYDIPAKLFTLNS